MFNRELKQTQISQTAIFTTGSMRASKILPSLILVLTIFLSDYFFDYSKNIKIIFLKLFQPITEIPFVINDISNRLGFFFSSQNNLYLEIEALNNEIEKLNFEILKMKNIEKENFELSELMNLTKKEEFSYSVLGEIKSKSFFPRESLSVTTDIKKVNEGMVVINRKGMMGQIYEIFPNSVNVHPIYEKDNIVPGYISRIDMNIILKGKGNDKLFLIENLNSEIDLNIGDEIYSSGLGGKFPKGYLIGKIKNIEKNPNIKYQTVEVQSIANFDSGSKVLFVSP